MKILIKSANQVILGRGYPVIPKEVARATYYARKEEDTKSKVYYMKKFNGEIMYDGKRSACNLEKHPNRFERMRENYPKQYKYYMKPGEGCLCLQ